MTSSLTVPSELMRDNSQMTLSIGHLILQGIETLNGHFHVQGLREHDHKSPWWIGGFTPHPDKPLTRRPSTNIALLNLIWLD